MNASIPLHFAHFSDVQEYLAQHAGGSPFDYARDNPKTLRTAESLGIGPQVAKAIEMSRVLAGDVAASVDRATRAEAKGRPINGAAHSKLSEARPHHENRSAGVVEAQSVDSGDWPDALASEAFHGLLGDIARELDPYTEADQAAIVLQAAVAFGALVGRGPHVPIEASQHHPGLFALLVGNTSKARKGTSWDRIKALFSEVSGWPRVVEGLSSGEGLKYAVRDAITKLEKDKAGFVQEVEVDAGVSDKRLLVVESEFSQVLRQCARPGNTLSATIRSAWDSGNLQTLTKNDAITATGAHIAIVGHITMAELQAELTATDSANGFANRFLFMAVKRSKRLPFPEKMDEGVRRGLTLRIEAAATKAKALNAVTFTPEAREAWAAVYPELSEGHMGLWGAVTARAEAQSLRVALIYALMDESDVIDLPHLRAALAVWERCDASARCIFGAALGDQIADELLRALRANGGMTRTQISGVFKRNAPAERIGAALALLTSRGLAKSRKSNDGPGRPSEIWEAV